MFEAYLSGRLQSHRNPGLWRDDFPFVFLEEIELLDIVSGAFRLSDLHVSSVQPMHLKYRSRPANSDGPRMPCIAVVSVVSDLAQSGFVFLQTGTRKPLSPT